MQKLLTVNPDEWRAEVPRIREHFAIFGDRLPLALGDEVDRLERELG
jgi:phosphoenolpyruvate carboxykinase (GTP)